MPRLLLIFILSLAQLLPLKAEKKEGAGLQLTFVNANYHYRQRDLPLLRQVEQREWTLELWQNDASLCELALMGGKHKLNKVELLASDFVSEDGHQLDRKAVELYFIDNTLAYKGRFLGYGNPNRAIPKANKDNRELSPDILDPVSPRELNPNQLQLALIKVKTSADTPKGVYRGSIQVKAEGLESPLQLSLKVKVLPLSLPKDRSFDLELWHYPYRSAEYYNVAPFSEEHLKILRAMMKLYQASGGNTITASLIEEPWAGQTYGKNKVKYPSMIKWIKKGEQMSYDFSDLDKWISFNKSLGLGDKIILYSIAPWHNSFAYWEEGELKFEKFQAGSPRYMTLWRHFLKALVRHLDRKGWFDTTHIGIDERGFNPYAFQIIDEVRNRQGKALKTAGALDHFQHPSKRPFALKIHNLTVGDNSAEQHKDDLSQIIEQRRALGLSTSLYSCTEHLPSNFSLSQPIESYWTVINASAMSDGFLRWAYDAWVADPLRDITHNAFEAGDTALVYPGERDLSKGLFVRSSLRLEWLAEGIRAVRKLRYILSQEPSLKPLATSYYRSMQMKAQVQGGGRLLTAEELQLVASDCEAFDQLLKSLTTKHINTLQE